MNRPVSGKVHGRKVAFTFCLTLFRCLAKYKFMSLIFKALSDPTRRRVLELLRRRPMSAGELADEFTVSKPTMSAHFAVLREAGLIVPEKQAPFP